jgi:monofunctional glycosyltransferase
MEEEPQQQISRPSLHRFSTGMKLLHWIKLHPIKSLLLFLFSSVLLQILFLPYSNIRLLKTKNVGETAFMIEHAEKAKNENRPFHKIQHWIPLRSIPQDAVDAVIVSEDGTFWSHHGFDWFEFRESIERNFEEGRAVRGASTITQQLVKNLYLSSSKNPLRKMKEWILTWYMEQQLSKSRILELYFNVIEWGDGVYGIEAASHYYFDKSASGLSREECARLAAIIPSPRKHRADVDSKYVLRRSTLILERMNTRGM